jgi:hypothetical protein
MRTAGVAHWQRQPRKRICELAHTLTVSQFTFLRAALC